MPWWWFACDQKNFVVYLTTVCNLLIECLAVAIIPYLIILLQLGLSRFAPSNNCNHHLFEPIVTEPRKHVSGKAQHFTWPLQRHPVMQRNTGWEVLSGLKVTSFGVVFFHVQQHAETNPNMKVLRAAVQWKCSWAAGMPHVLPGQVSRIGDFRCMAQGVAKTISQYSTRTSVFATLFEHTREHAHVSHVHAYMPAHTHEYARTHAHMHTCTHAHMHTYTCICYSRRCLEILQQIRPASISLFHFHMNSYGFEFHLHWHCVKNIFTVPEMYLFAKPLLDETDLDFARLILRGVFCIKVLSLQWCEQFLGTLGGRVFE